MVQIKQLLPKGIAVGKLNLEREFIVRTKVRKQSYSADVSNKLLLERIKRDWGIV